MKAVASSLKAAHAAHVASKGDRSARLASLASKAQARHESLAAKGLHPGLVNALDRSIAIKRAAHEARQDKAAGLFKLRSADPRRQGKLDLKESPATRALPGTIAGNKAVHPVDRAADVIHGLAAQAASGKLDRSTARAKVAEAFSKLSYGERNRLTRDLGLKTHETTNQALDAVEAKLGKIGKKGARDAVSAIMDAKREARRKSAEKPRPRWVDDAPPAPKAIEAPARALPAPAAPARNTAARKRLAERLRADRSAVAASRVDPGSHANHAPGTITELNTDLVHADPSRFQYKTGLTDSQSGTTDALHGIRHWDPELGGILQAWKDPENGKAFVVNGHHRLALAKKLGAKKVAVRFIDAKDHVEARAKGALTNIAEGRGTSTDAGKFFRDMKIGREDIERRGIPMREKVATEGLALANLHPELFNHVVTGEMPVARGAVIGGSGLDHTQQMGLHKRIGTKGRELTNSALHDYIADSKAAGVKKGTGQNMFGDDEDDIDLGLHRARVVAHIKDRLSKEKKLFGTVAKSKNAGALERGNNTIDTETSGKISDEAAQALGIFDTLRNSAGPIAKHLHHAAERLAAGHAAKTVHAEAYRNVLGSLTDAAKF